MGGINTSNWGGLLIKFYHDDCDISDFVEASSK